MADASDLKSDGSNSRVSSSLTDPTNFIIFSPKGFIKQNQLEKICKICSKNSNFFGLCGANKTIPDIGNIRTPRCFYVQKTKYMVIRQFSMRSIEWECKEWSMIKTVHLTCLKNGFPNDELGLMMNQ